MAKESEKILQTRGYQMIWWLYLFGGIGLIFACWIVTTIHEEQNQQVRRKIKRQ